MVLDKNTQQWGEDYRVPFVPPSITCQLFPGDGDCEDVRLHWTDSVTLPGISVFFFGKPVSVMDDEANMSILLRTGSTSRVPTAGLIETRQHPIVSEDGRKIPRARST